MKAIIYTQYGPPEVLKLTEVARPVPQKNEVLIRVYASTVTSGDWRMRKAQPFAVRLINGLFKPKRTILGTEFAGEVEAIGPMVGEFKVGDAVYGATGMKMGTNAEYICMPESDAIAHKPSNLSFEEAAAIPFGGTAALVFLRDKGKIEAGEKILVYGASGSVGTAAVQLAKSFGAEVHGVCSTQNVELVQALGADRVFDYKKEDFAQSGEAYDLIFDTVGKSPFSACVKALKPKGRYLRAVHLSLSPLLRGLWVSLTSSKKVIGGVAMERKADLVFLKDLIEAGQMRAVIDRSYPLAQTAEAHAYVEKGHKKGNVVLTV